MHGLQFQRTRETAHHEHRCQELSLPTPCTPSGLREGSTLPLSPPCPEPGFVLSCWPVWFKFLNSVVFYFLFLKRRKHPHVNRGNWFIRGQRGGLISGLKAPTVAVRLWAVQSSEASLLLLATLGLSPWRVALGCLSVGLPHLDPEGWGRMTGMREQGRPHLSHPLHSLSLSFPQMLARAQNVLQRPLRCGLPPLLPQGPETVQGQAQAGSWRFQGAKPGP